jgi:hypothetical protein
VGSGREFVARNWLRTPPSIKASWRIPTPAANMNCF